MPKGAILGDMADRIKTDVRFPRKLVEHVEECCLATGVPKNAFYALGVGILVVMLTPLLPGQRRKDVLSRIEKIFQTIISEARKSA